MQSVFWKYYKCANLIWKSLQIGYNYCTIKKPSGNNAAGRFLKKDAVLSLSDEK